jgi:hypothetical protein
VSAVIGRRRDGDRLSVGEHLDHPGLVECQGAVEADVGDALCPVLGGGHGEGLDQHRGRDDLHPGDPADKDLYDLEPEEAKNIPTVCHSLDMALEAGV